MCKRMRGGRRVGAGDHNISVLVKGCPKCLLFSFIVASFLREKSSVGWLFEEAYHHIATKSAEFCPVMTISTMIGVHRKLPLRSTKDLFWKKTTEMERLGDEDQRGLRDLIFFLPCFVTYAERQMFIVPPWW